MSGAPSADAGYMSRGSSTEEIAMPINDTQDDARNILDALRVIQDSPALKAEAQTNPDKVMDRLGLAGIARHAVAFAITAAAVSPIAYHGFTPNGFWK
jgi:hypothetical protein